MNVHPWKYSIHRLCMACYSNMHVNDQEQWTQGVCYWDQISVLCRCSLFSSQLWPCSNPWVQGSVCECYPKMYTLVWVLSLPLIGVPACASCAERTCCRAAAKAVTFPSAVSDCFWEENVSPSAEFGTSITLTHKCTLLASLGISFLADSLWVIVNLRIWMIFLLAHCPLKHWQDLRGPATFHSQLSDAQMSHWQHLNSVLCRTEASSGCAGF